MSTNPWLEELHGGKGKNVPRRKVQKPKLADLKRIVMETPEVVVKVSRSTETTVNGTTLHPSPRSAFALRGVAAYISRDGEQEMIDEQGLIFLGPDAVKDAVEGWDMPETSDRREALHIIMGMPKESKDGSLTDVAAVERAAQETAAKVFKGHMYLMAHHQDSESGNPHSHLIVKIEPINGGKRLDPRKAQLRQYRETFAQALRDNGVEANATSKVSRLSTRRSLTKNNYRHLKNTDTERLRERTTQGVTDAHRAQFAEYRQIATDLARSSDEGEQALALDLVRFLSEKTGIALPAQPKQVQAHGMVAGESHGPVQSF